MKRIRERRTDNPYFPKIIPTKTNFLKSACLNLQECNDPARSDCVGKKFKEKGLGALVLTQPKLKEKEGFEFAKVAGRVSSVGTA